MVSNVTNSLYSPKMFRQVTKVWTTKYIVRIGYTLMTGAKAAERKG